MEQSTPPPLSSPTPSFPSPLRSEITMHLPLLSLQTCTRFCSRLSHCPCCVCSNELFRAPFGAVRAELPAPDVSFTTDGTTTDRGGSRIRRSSVGGVASSTAIVATASGALFWLLLYEFQQVRDYRVAVVFGVYVIGTCVILGMAQRLCCLSDGYFSLRFCLGASGLDPRLTNPRDGAMAGSTGFVGWMICFCTFLCTN